MRIKLAFLLTLFFIFFYLFPSFTFAQDSSHLLACSSRPGSHLDASKDVKYTTESYQNELNQYCSFQDDPTIEFPIYVYIKREAVEGDNVLLELSAFDVDSDHDGSGGCEPEHLEVFINNQLVGTMLGNNQSWGTTLFSVPASDIRFLGDNHPTYGKNMVKILRDPETSDQGNLCWWSAVDYGTLKVRVAPVIFLPGIGGTKLYNGNTSPFNFSEAWPQIIESIVNFGQDSHLDVLALDSDGSNSKDPFVDIYVGKPLSLFYGKLKSFYTDRGIFAEDTFWKFQSKIPLEAKVITPLEPSNARYFEFGYDWRFRTDQISNIFAQNVAQIKSQTGANKIAVFGHSTGGVVFRDYQRNNPSDTKLFISMGAPYHGAGKAYGVLKNAVSFAAIYDDNKTSSLAQNYPGLYALLPNQPYFEIYDYVVDDQFDNNPPNGHLTLTETYQTDPEAKLGNQGIAQWAINFFNQQTGFAPAMDIHEIYGIKPKAWTNRSADSTYRQFRMTKDPDTNRPVFQVLQGSGDGTVPLFSAYTFNLFLPGVDERRMVPYEHNSMVGKQDVMQYTWDQYTDTTFMPGVKLNFSNFSDQGLDTDGDSLFDYLEISLNANASVAGSYTLIGYLRDQNGIFISESFLEVSLNTGNNSITLSFPGYHFFDQEVQDQNYSLSIQTHFNGEFQGDQENIYTTNTYSADEFNEAPDINIDQNFQISSFSESTQDTNGDSQIDILNITINANIGLTDDYEIWGLLRENNPNSEGLSYVQKEVLLQEGAQQVSLPFPASELNTSGSTAFVLDLIVKDSYDNKLELPAIYVTQLYDPNDLADSPATLTDQISDIGVDTNGNGLYEYLDVTLTLDVLEAGDYQVAASLFSNNQDGSAQTLGITSQSTTLNPGLQNITLRFEGVPIRQSDINGPYFIANAQLYYRGSLIEEVDFLGITGNYLATQFEPPIIAIQGISDEGIDDDGNGFYDRLVVYVDVITNSSQTYTAGASLYGSDYTPIDTDDDVQTGSSFTLRFEFDGREIFRSGISGPYIMDSLSINFPNDTQYFTGERYLTGPYKYTEFDRESYPSPISDGNPTLVEFSAWSVGVDANGSSVLTDIDNDQDLDFVYVDENSFGVYLSTATGFQHSPNFSQGLFPGSWASLAAGDIDNDGDIDVIQAGRVDEGKVQVLINDGMSLVPDLNWNQNLPAFYSGDFHRRISASLADVDDDGLLDLTLLGVSMSGRISSIYRNTGNSFVLHQDLIFNHGGGPQTGVAAGGVVFGDLNNDSNLDLVLIGVSGSGYVGYTYINDGSGNFTIDPNYNFEGLRLSNLALGDLDNDGDLDLFIAGKPEFPGDVFIATVFLNTGNGFVENPSFASTLPVGLEPQIAFGDIDSDGDLDLAYSIRTQGPGPLLTEGGIYINTGSAFVYDNNYSQNLGLPAYQPGVTMPSFIFSDFDNDGLLDLTTSEKTFLNRNTPIINTDPSPPNFLNSQTGTSSVILAWDGASDGQTPSTSLAYDLRVGSCPGCSDIVSPHFGGFSSPTSGYFGNMWQRKSVNLVLSNGTYYWSVRSVDSGLRRSLWSSESNFTF